MLEDMLRHYVSPFQDDWDQYLSCATCEFAINNAEHKSTGASPFMLNYGFSPKIPYSIERRTKSRAAYEFVQSMQRRLMEARTLHWVASSLET